MTSVEPTEPAEPPLSQAGGRGASRRRCPIGNLFIGTAVSRIGDSVTLVALIWIMFERTQSAGGVALVQFAYTVLVPVGGLLVGEIGRASCRERV